MSVPKETMSSASIVCKPPGPWYLQRIPIGFVLHMFFIFALNRFPLPLWFLILVLVWHEVSNLLLIGCRKASKKWLTRIVALVGLLSSYLDWYVQMYHPETVWKLSVLRTVAVFAIMTLLSAAWKDIGSVLFCTITITAATRVFLSAPSDDFIAQVSIVAASDAFQYFVGKRFGKFKPVPEISPNKTLEGYIGGIILCNFLSLLISLNPLDPEYILWYNGVLICGIVGDLSISSWKRFHMLKDTSDLLSSHGGVLDRLYSHVASFLWTVVFMAPRSQSMENGFGFLDHFRIALVTQVVWSVIWAKFLFGRVRRFLLKIKQSEINSRLKE